MASWTYNVPGTWRCPDGSDKMVRVVVGLPEDPLSAELYVNVNSQFFVVWDGRYWGRF